MNSILNLEAQEEDDDTLRSTSEGRIWIAVTTAAALELINSLEWIENGYLAFIERKNKERERGKLTRSRFDFAIKWALWHRRELCRSSRPELRTAREYFWTRDSLFPTICSVLGYEPSTFRTTLLPYSKALRRWERKLPVVRRPREFKGTRRTRTTLQQTPNRGFRY